VRRATPETLDAWAALLAAHRRLTQALDDELHPVGLSLDEYDVLLQVRRSEQPLRMTQLAERALISRPTASRVVDRLVERGWVRRWRDATDGRVVLLALTEEGRRVHTAAARVHLDGIARLVQDPLTGSDVTALAGALHALAGGGCPPTAS
jgi:DNA-binding MarR family transcriptional regulator